MYDTLYADQMLYMYKSKVKTGHIWAAIPRSTTVTKEHGLTSHKL